MTRPRDGKRETSGSIFRTYQFSNSALIVHIQLIPTVLSAFTADEQEDNNNISEMSFGEKIASIMQRPGQDPVAKDDVPWWMKYAGRGLGTVGSIIAIFLGAWNCASILFGQIDCLISGMWQMIAGFLVVMIEAPCCCLFIDFVQNLSDWVEKKPYWNRATAYCLIALPAVFLCPGMSSIFGSGLIFATGIIYGLMSLGKKAPFGEMRTAAMDVQAPSSSMRSTLVENTQPIGLSNIPVKYKLDSINYTRQQKKSNDNDTSAIISQIREKEKQRSHGTYQEN